MRLSNLIARVENSTIAASKAVAKVVAPKASHAFNAVGKSINRAADATLTAIDNARVDLAVYHAERRERFEAKVHARMLERM